MQRPRNATFHCKPRGRGKHRVGLPHAGRRLPSATRDPGVWSCLELYGLLTWRTSPGQPFSQNLCVLCDARLLNQGKSATSACAQANRDAVGPLEPFLRAMWADDLDRLREVVECDQRERTS